MKALLIKKLVSAFSFNKKPFQIESHERPTGNLGHSAQLQRGMLAALDRRKSLEIKTKKLCFKEVQICPHLRSNC